MSLFVERALELRKQAVPHINCAQAVVIPFSEALGVPSDYTMRFAAGFGGGMRRGSVCGAVTGGVMALGLYGIDDPETLRVFYERLGHSGHLDCAELITEAMSLGIDRRVHCEAMIVKSVETVEQILAEKNKLEKKTAADL